MHITRRRGRASVQFDEGESDLLGLLLDNLVDDVSGHDGDPVVRERLYPAAYRDDIEAETEFRSLTEDGLRTERLERIEQCAAEVDGGFDLTDEAAARRWIQVLNDLRLVLGTRLGVTEESPVDLEDLDPAVPGYADRTVYVWLTHVQDLVVTELMGR